MEGKQLARRVIVCCGVAAALLGGQVRAEVYYVWGPQWPLSEWVQRSDAVCLAKWVSSSTPSSAGFRDATLEIVAILKSPPRSLRKGDRFDFRCSASEDKPGLFLLLGDYDPSRRAVNWKSPEETTRACFDYVAGGTSYADQPKRLLGYVLQFVDTQDKLIRADVIQELKDARVENLRAAVGAMPRDKFRKLLVGAETPDELPGLCCYLLGFCGENSSGAGEDIKRLEAKVTEKEPTGGYRRGTEHMMMGYLMLAGEAGLDHLDAWKIKDPSAPFGETYSAMLALRFLWKNGNGKISHDRLVQSMRLFLDRPDLADIAIADLARWHDWNSLDRIVSLYGKGPFNVPSIKRAIIRYLYSCAEPKPTAVLPEQAETAKRLLGDIRHKDPQRVAEVDRFWFRQSE